MNRIWMVERSGSIAREETTDHIEAMNRAKSTSLRNYCTFLHTSNGKFFVFEHGEQADGRRAKELSDQTEAALLRDYSRDMMKNQKRNKKK